MSGGNDLDATIERMRAATADFVNGKNEAFKALCSRAPDATLFGGWGAYERGWEQLGPRYDWAAARFASGQVTVEEIARNVSGDLAYTVHLERGQVRLAEQGRTVPMALRVTHIYRREDGAWKLVHRHADPIAAVQAPESVIER